MVRGLRPHRAHAAAPAALSLPRPRPPPPPVVRRSAPGAGVVSAATSGAEETAGEVKKQPRVKWVRPSFRSRAEATPQEAQSNGHAPSEGGTQTNSPVKSRMFARKPSVSKGAVSVATAAGATAAAVRAAAGKGAVATAAAVTAAAAMVEEASKEAVSASTEEAVSQEMHTVSHVRVAQSRWLQAREANDRARRGVTRPHHPLRHESAILRDAELPQHSAHTSEWKHNMTTLEGALLVQRLVRGQQARKTVLNTRKKLHVQYEIKIIEQRQERRKLVSQFLMHVVYMTIMVSVFILQHGHSVRSRYSMVAVLKQYVDSTITPTGIAFETIRTIPDVWEWTEALIAKTAVSMVAVPEDEDEDAAADTQTEATGVDSRWVVPDEDADAESQRRQLKAAAVRGASATAAAGGGAAVGVGAIGGGAAAGGGGRVFIRTYNQLVGTVRIETLRVDADSCDYKGFPWAQQILNQRRPALTASDTTTCYGSKKHLSTTPFGPWYDPTRWVVHEKPGNGPNSAARYVIDLGKDPTFARLKIAEGRHDKFLSEFTRRIVISFVIYNNVIYNNPNPNPNPNLSGKQGCRTVLIMLFMLFTLFALYHTLFT